MYKITVLFTAILISSPISVQAATCEQFKAGIVEGAAHYQVPAPKFELVHVNEADANIRYWSITMFGDVRSVMSCWYGWVGTFAADANDSEMSSVHLSLLMGIGLYSYGMEWREALGLRDQLVPSAKVSDLQTARFPVEGGEASLVISVAGVPSFQIDTEK